MAVSMETLGQISLFSNSSWRTTVRMEPDHRLAILCRSIPWEELMERVVPILYAEQGTSEEKGCTLNLRSHLGIYILQTVHGWTDRWSEEMLNYYIPARLFCGFLESEGSREQKDWYPAQGKPKFTSQHKGPKRAIGPPGRDRTPNCPSQKSGTRTKSNENRSWKLNFRLPVCPILQFKPFDERSRNKGDEFGTGLMKCYAAPQKSTRSFGSASGYVPVGKKMRSALARDHFHFPPETNYPV